MSYFIIFEPDYSRLLPAILIDCRSSIPQIANQNGWVIKTYCDSQVALIKSNSLFYKIETDKGVIAAIFSIDVNTNTKGAVLVMTWVRPAFKGFTEISDIITNFINTNGYVGDYLFD